MSTTKCPWGVLPSLAQNSLTDVMSEQLSQQLVDEDSHDISGPLGDLPSSSSYRESHDYSETEEMIRNALANDHSNTDDDYLIALMLQDQFNLEHDEELKRYESAKNGNSKVSISYENHRLCSSARYNELCKEDELDDEEDDDFDDESEYIVDNRGGLIKVDKFGRPILQLNRQGYCGKGVHMKTKHDAEVSEHRNMAKAVNSFAPTFATGDLDGLSTKRLTNRVYNQLKHAANVDDKRRHRLKEPTGEDFSTVEHAVDTRTRRILFRLLQQDRLQSINGIVSSGKESIVLYAEGGSGQTITGKHFPAHCAIKVFKTTLTGFRHRRMYVESDYRFRRNDLKKRQNPRKVIRLWAAKEALNLSRMKKCGLPCPEPIMVRQHVLVMDFIGDPKPDGIENKSQSDALGNIPGSAPTLHVCSAINGRLTIDEWRQAYSQSKQYMERLYTDCQLVHADLSEYNLLWHNNKVWIIDVSQAVDINHKYSWDFLRRDCANITNFFTKVLPPEEITPYEDLFNNIVGVKIDGYGQDFLNNFRLYVSTMRVQQLQSSKKNRDNMLAGLDLDDLELLAMDDAFDVVELVAMRDSCLQQEPDNQEEEDEEEEYEDDEQ